MYEETYYNVYLIEFKSFQLRLCQLEILAIKQTLMIMMIIGCGWATDIRRILKFNIAKFNVSKLHCMQITMKICID